MDDSNIRKQLAKITDSECFSRSSIYKKLLSYLTDATLKGEKPKEFTIGFDVFNHTADDTNTSNIRVHIHKLRKKLDAYYSSEGMHDNIFFTIPKGAYSLEFKDKKHKTHITQGKYLWFGISAIVIIGILIVQLCFITQKSDYSRLKKSAFWKELILNKNETLIVAGDFFIFENIKLINEYDRYRMIRDMGINSKEQLQEYLNSDESLEAEDYQPSSRATYMPRDALLSMPYIIPMLHENNIDYQIILSSNFNWELYSDRNIIYIGAFKNLKSLTLLTDKLLLEYDNQNDLIILNDPKEKKEFSSTMYTVANIDYSLISKVPGPNNNVVYFFVSDNDIGCIESVKYFTNPDSVKSFEKTTMKDARFFKSIYKAEGIERTGISFDLNYYESITDSALNNFWYY